MTKGRGGRNTPVKPPSASMVRKAAKALATGRASAKDTRSMAGRIAAEREAVVPDKSKRR